MCIATAAQRTADQPLSAVEAAEAVGRAIGTTGYCVQIAAEIRYYGRVACDNAEKVKAAGKQSSVLCQVLMSMVYVSLWMSLSGAVIMYNNWILVFYDFPFPVTLTMWHMGFSSVLATICVKAGWIPGEKKMTSEVYLRTVLPGAILFAGALFLGNSVYVHLSIAFIQMLKSLGTVAVFSTGCIFGVEKYSLTAFANMVFVTMGVAIASYGEIKFVVMGVILQVAAVALDSIRVILVQVLLQKRGLSLNPILTLYYIAPASFCFLSILWVFLEKDAVLAHPIGASALPVFLLNGVAAFGLNLSVFLLIGKTSALSMNVAGVVKDWCLIGLSVFIFGAQGSEYGLYIAQLSRMGVAGYSLALAGACWYNYRKLQAMKGSAGLSRPTPLRP